MAVISLLMVLSEGKWGLKSSLDFTLSEAGGAMEYVYLAWSLSFDMQMEVHRE